MGAHGRRRGVAWRGMAWHDVSDACLCARSDAVDMIAHYDIGGRAGAGTSPAV